MEQEFSNYTDFNKELISLIEKAFPNFTKFTEKEKDQDKLFLFSKEDIKLDQAIPNRTVWKGQFEGKADKVVVKFLTVNFKSTVPKNYRQDMNDLINEIKNIKNLKFEKHIPKFWGIYCGKINPKDTEERIGNVFTFIEGPTLEEATKNNKKFFAKPEEQYRVASEIIDIVEFLHKNNMTHRDISTKNIILNEKKKNTAFLIDFGDSKMSKDVQTNYETQNRWISRYVAPELFVNVGTPENPSYVVTQAFDIWSLGAIIYQLYTFEAPYKADSDNKIMQLHGDNNKKIQAEKLKNKDANVVLYTDGKFTSDFPYVRGFASKFVDLLKVTSACLKVEAKNRCDIKTLKKLMKDFKDATDDD